jgi:hypothetical protein
MSKKLSEKAVMAESSSSLDSSKEADDNQPDFALKNFSFLNEITQNLASNKNKRLVLMFLN